jgi:apolipoprotein N-acyltransferase
MRTRAFSVLAPAFVSGLLVTLSHPFAPAGVPWLGGWNGLLAWVALVPWWLSVRGEAPHEAFRRTWLFAATFFAGTLYWVVIALHRFGGVDAATSVLLLLLLAAFLATFHAPAAALAAYARDRMRLPPELSMPVLWAGAEWLRASLFTGFPWSNLGYTQWRVLPVAQIADLTGVHGVAALVVAVNVAIAEIAVRAPRARRRLAVAAAMLALAMVYGASRIRDVDADRAARPLVRVALVQGNVSQDQKHDEGEADRIRAIYAGQLEAAEASLPDLVVWPEAAIPGGIHVRSAWLPDADLPAPNSTWLLAGTATWWDENGERLAHNSALLVAPGRRIAASYHKSHLVPFGEYVPWKRLFFFARKLTRYSGDFRPGTDPSPLPFPKARLGVLICYEDVFPDPARAETAAGADLLVNVTNDAWYGRSSAPWQHLSMSVFRAIETRRAVLRSTQTGVTAEIDSSGRLRRATALFEGPEAMIVEAAAGGPGSFYVHAGDLFGVACVAAGAALAGLARRAGTL